VQGAGCRVQGAGCRVWGVPGVGCRVWGVRFRVDEHHSIPGLRCADVLIPSVFLHASAQLLKGDFVGVHHKAILAAICRMCRVVRARPACLPTTARGSRICVVLRERRLLRFSLRPERCLGPFAERRRRPTQSPGRRPPCPSPQNAGQGTGLVARLTCCGLLTPDPRLMLLPCHLGRSQVQCVCVCVCVWRERERSQVRLHDAHALSTNGYRVHSIPIRPVHVYTSHNACMLSRFTSSTQGIHTRHTYKANI